MFCIVLSGSTDWLQHKTMHMQSFNYNFKMQNTWTTYYSFSLSQFLRSVPSTHYIYDSFYILRLFKIQLNGKRTHGVVQVFFELGSYRIVCCLHFTLRGITDLVSGISVKQQKWWEIWTKNLMCILHCVYLYIA